MNIEWLAKNLVSAWRYRHTTYDAMMRLLFIYQHKLPRLLRKQEVIIGFHYVAPIGTIRLVMRANRGSDAFIHSEVFEHRYYDLRLDTTPLRILDLGANVGFTAIYFGRSYPTAEIVCVEPVPGNVACLRRNLEMNHIDARIIEAAIHCRDGFVSMQLSPMDYGHKVSSGDVSLNGHSIQVPSISMVTLFKTLRWDEIDLLKIDIEGYERELLSGECAWLRNVKVLCIECHDGFEDELPDVAFRHGFAKPTRLPGIWLLQRVGSA